MFTEELNTHLIQLGFPVKCFAIHPGTIRSNWYENNCYSRLFITIFGFMFKVIILEFHYCLIDNFLLFRLKLRELNDLNMSVFQNSWNTPVVVI